MTANRKRHLKSEFARFQTSSILFNFIFISQIMLAKLGGGGAGRGGGLNLKGPYLSLEKEKRKCLCCVHLLHKEGAKKLVIFMSQSRNNGKENVKKSMMQVQNCCFANIHLFQKGCRRGRRMAIVEWRLYDERKREF